MVSDQQEQTAAGEGTASLRSHTRPEERADALQICAYARGGAVRVPAAAPAGRGRRQISIRPADEGTVRSTADYR